MMLSLRPAAIANFVRLARAKHRHKTVRFKVGDLRGFYAAMNARDIPYVVLRWVQDVPLDATDPQAFEHDVDHLIGRFVIDDIRDIASQRPGLAKCDFYSMTGERGSAYRRFPYLTPALADEILKNRENINGVFYTPTPRHMFFAFAYHLVYHKGVESGIEPNLNGAIRKPDPSRDYLSELQQLAGAAGVDLPSPVTLLSVHQLLKLHHWNMPFDLMVRWPNQHSVMQALAEVERESLAALAAETQDINVFVVRNDCEGPESLRIVREMIAERFSVLDEVELNETEVKWLSRLTRGGNWFEKHYPAAASPTHMFVCKQSVSRGPLPAGMTLEKVQARYPHISHTDVLIKRDIRAAVNAKLGGAATRIVLHATDNALESAETLAAVKDDGALAYLRSLRKPAAERSEAVVLDRTSSSGKAK